MSIIADVRARYGADLSMTATLQLATVGLVLYSLASIGGHLHSDESTGSWVIQEYLVNQHMLAAVLSISTEALYDMQTGSWICITLAPHRVIYLDIECIMWSGCSNMPWDPASGPWNDGQISVRRVANAARCFLSARVGIKYRRSTSTESILDGRLKWSKPAPPAPKKSPSPTTTKKTSTTATS